MGHIHSVSDIGARFKINSLTREITNADGVKSLIQFDHNSERFTFEIPRYIEGHDMLLCSKIEIHFLNIGSTGQSADVYIVDDVEIAPSIDDTLTFSWLISGNATKYEGTLNFLIRFVCLDGEEIEYSWNTAIYSGVTVSKGMNNGEAVIAEYSDVLEKWKNEIVLSSGEFVGIESVEINEDGELVITYTTGAVVNVGKVVGENGATKTTARIADVTILASEWVGEESPYSQIVTIEGVTENSQVDLTPSVEQLSIFYNKDLAFVTENENGVVTVFAIGQKPTNDYVIQATITEVAR